MTNKPLVDEFATAMDVITEERDRQDRTTSAGVEIERVEIAAAPKAETESDIGQLVTEVAVSMIRWAMDKGQDLRDYREPMLHVLAAALHAQPEAQKGAPVAWLVGGGDSPIMARNAEWVTWMRDVHGAEVTPPYTHPAPSSELPDALGLAEYVLKRVQVEGSDAHLVKDAGVALEAIAKRKGPQ